MAVFRRRTGLVALPVMIVAVVLLFVVLGGAEARPLRGSGGGWTVAGAGPLPDGGGVFFVETLRRLYLQQLGGPGASCQTNSPNNGCPP